MTAVGTCDFFYLYICRIQTFSTFFFRIARNFSETCANVLRTCCESFAQKYFRTSEKDFSQDFGTSLGFFSLFFEISTSELCETRKKKFLFLIFTKISQYVVLNSTTDCQNFVVIAFFCLRQKLIFGEIFGDGRWYMWIFFLYIRRFTFSTFFFRIARNFSETCANVL